MRGVLAIAATLMLAAAADAQAVREYETLDTEELQQVAQQSGLQVVAIEPVNIMVSDGKGFPARLSLAGCDAHGRCRVVRIYTRYVIGRSDRGMAAVNEFSRNFTSTTLILTLAMDEPAVDVGRDASLEGGRTSGEIAGEIATAMSDARLLRDKLMEADPFLKATLGRR
jgi:hypothetical protein